MEELIWSHRRGRVYVLDKTVSVNLARYRQVCILNCVLCLIVDVQH